MKFIAIVILSLSIFNNKVEAQNISSKIDFKEVPVKVLVEDDMEVLLWTLKKEVNTSFFIIERSEDGIVFSAVATVKAKGHSVLPTNYSFEWISNSPSANATYRVVLVGMDGVKTVVGINTVENDMFKNLASQDTE